MFFCNSCRNCISKSPKIIWRKWQTQACKRILSRDSNRHNIIWFCSYLMISLFSIMRDFLFFYAMNFDISPLSLTSLIPMSCMTETFPSLCQIFTNMSKVFVTIFYKQKANIFNSIIFTYFDSIMSSIELLYGLKFIIFLRAIGRYLNSYFSLSLSRNSNLEN